MKELFDSYKEHVDLLELLDGADDYGEQYHQLKAQKKHIKTQLYDLLDEAYQSRDDLKYEEILSVLKYDAKTPHSEKDGVSAK